ncbi:MAG: hypothetical protein GTO45_23880 [Candidatus Aminicenantes bacterium]|nr:hypothetical protein [Candidatus Aminicenantes bacterium]NIM81797.1 hypothetical protein [Candidatus Aminicenantes bacterium]NIN21169.1 hypothetical protein [Candidatus Aminicenantes bacterium]NIN44993.1 hypothetical protein [Candidatus Aminicenantes bacterium]NIN87807.1 hypothetical protein [Candidatus Aminicenantes bacterium]
MINIERTPEETQQYYIERMGEELGAFFFELRNDVIFLFQKWIEYHYLFVEKESRLDYLNKAAPNFFWIVEKTLFYDIILHIARLIEESGRPRGKGKPNLTLRYLPNLIDDKETELKPDVKKLISNAQKKAAFSNDWRNRRIAHKDLQLTMNDAVQPLEDVP